MFSRLLALFIIIPIIELYLFLTLGKMIGVPLTLVIIVLTAILGASLTKAQGLGVLSRMNQASAEGRLPHQEVLDGVMILIAGAFLLTPGFLTDAVGFTLLFPPARAILRSKVGSFLMGKVTFINPGGSMPRSSSPQDKVSSQDQQPKQSKDGEVIDVEIL